MKKIKRNRQLAARYKNLKAREEKLEVQISADWKAIKQQLRPGQILKALFKQVS